MRRVVIAGVGLIVLGAARGAPAAMPRGLTLSASLSAAAPLLSPKQVGIGLEAALPLLAERLEVAAGLRVLTGSISPNPGIAGHLRAGLVAAFVRWRPAAGLELEVNSASKPEARSDSGTIAGSLEEDAIQAAKWDLFRIAGFIAPVRLLFGGLALSALEIAAGTPLSGNFGSVLTVRIVVLKAGWRF